MAANAKRISNDEPDEAPVPNEAMHPLFLRISDADRAALDALVERLPMTATAIARIALRVGLVELTKNPALVLEAKKKTRARKPKE